MRCHFSGFAMLQRLWAHERYKLKKKKRKKSFFCFFFHLSVFIYGFVRDILIAAVKSVEAAELLVLFLFVFFTLLSLFH